VYGTRQVRFGENGGIQAPHVDKEEHEVLKVGSVPEGDFVERDVRPD
jgi:hypothetical protein